MKIHKLTIHNIGKIEDATIEFNKALNLFYGEIMAGKTTILNSIKLCFGGAYPDDLITFGKDDGFVKLEFDDSSITRGFVRKVEKIDDVMKTVIKAKPILYIKNNQVVNKPIEAIKNFLNPFLLNQDHLIHMTEHERKKYFCELFDVDVVELEFKEKSYGKATKELRTFIKGMGDINPVEVEKPNLTELNDERKNIIMCAELKVRANRTTIDKVIGENKKREDTNKKILELELKIAQIQDTITYHKSWLENVIEVDVPERVPDDYISMRTKDIDEKISNAKADEVRYENYLSDVKKLKGKQYLEEQLKETNNKLRQVRDEKLKKLSEITSNSTVKGLEFTEDGSFKFEGISAGMLSTSQLMTLSSLLTKLYPDSLGIELIDKGESLGRRIFEFADRAEKEKRTILATIVSDKPAFVPENIGVFVVENGKVESK